MTKRSGKKQKKIINLISNFFIIFAVLLLYLIFAPVVGQEAKYQIQKTKRNVELTPPNYEFSIVIPKIEAVAPVFENTDPFNEKEFLPVLREGVAHAKGSALPGQSGNVYIFAHSTDAFYNVGRYNAVFYLIGKLEEGDEIYIYYKGDRLTYKVYDKKVVAADDIKYLNKLSDKNTLTLQTCYPPGTTLKRLVVLAEEASSVPD